MERLEEEGVDEAEECWIAWWSPLGKDGCIVAVEEAGRLGAAAGLALLGDGVDDEGLVPKGFRKRRGRLRTVSSTILAVNGMSENCLFGFAERSRVGPKITPRFCEVILLCSDCFSILLRWFISTFSVSKCTAGSW